MKKKWFYVDITTNCHEQVAVMAEDEEEAKSIAVMHVDSGDINFSEAADHYGSISDEIAIADGFFKKPPKNMRRFDRNGQLDK